MISLIHDTSKVQDFVEVKNKEYRTPFYRTHPVAASGFNCLTLLLDKKNIQVKYLTTIELF